jgi:hypothetical protein
MEGRRTVCEIDWKNDIFGRCVTARAELASCGTVGSALHSSSGSDWRLRTDWCWCDVESRSKMEIPAKIE